MNGTAKLLPKELHWASPHQASRALNYVCNHLCFVSVYFGHFLYRWVLRYQKSLRKVIFSIWKCSKLSPYKLMVTALSILYQFQLRKSFTGMLYFWKLQKPVLITCIITIFILINGGRDRGRGRSRLLAEQGAWHRAWSQDLALPKSKADCVTQVLLFLFHFKADFIGPPGWLS